MPTVLVIDDDPLVAASVRSAVPSWTVLEASDGLIGMTMARAYHESLDLIVLDVRMPHHDGILVCVQIRTEYPELPILPLTAAVDAVSILSGLGCSAPLLKPVSLERLAHALHSANDAHPPPLTADPLLPYVQRQAAASEQAAHQERSAPTVALLTSSELLRSGIRSQVTAVGGTVRLEATGASVLRLSLTQLPVDLLVADAQILGDAAAIASEFGLPLLIIALTLTAGSRVDGRAHGVVVDPVAPDTLADALLAVAAGATYRDPILDMPIASDRLTKTEQKIVSRLLQGMRVEAIAAELAVQPDTIYQHRSHIYAKLGVSDLEEIRARLDTQHALRAREAGR